MLQKIYWQNFRSTIDLLQCLSKLDWVCKDDTKTFQDIIIFTGEVQHSKEACELVAHTIVTVGELKQKEKPMEKKGLLGTKPPKGTNGIPNGHNERLENGILLWLKIPRRE